MRTLRVCALLLTVSGFGPIAHAAAQGDEAYVIGLIREDGVAVPKAALASARWTGIGATEPTLGTGVVLVDTAGVARELSLGPATHDYDMYDGGWTFQTDLPDPVTEVCCYPIPRIGYFVSALGDDSAFLPVESGMSEGEWLALTERHTPDEDHRAKRVRARVWRAADGDAAVTFFEVSRQVDISPGCPPLFVFYGWKLNDEAPFTVAGSIQADCEGKGSESRRPWALIKRGASYYAFLSAGGWESDRSEVWQVRGGEAPNVVWSEY